MSLYLRRITILKGSHTLVTGIETLWAKNHHLHNHAFIQSMLVFKQGQKSVECLLMSTTRIFNLINIMQYLYQMSILTIVLLLRRLIDVKSLFKPIVKQGFGQNSSYENSNFKIILSN